MRMDRWMMDGYGWKRREGGNDFLVGEAWGKHGRPGRHYSSLQSKG